MSPSDRLWLSRHLRRQAARYELRHMDEERRDALEMAEAVSKLNCDLHHGLDERRGDLRDNCVAEGAHDTHWSG